MIINKFGGEIMADPHLVSLAAQHIARQIKKGLQPVIVVSALKGVTDDLEKRLHEHNNYKNRWTSGKGTWKLVYYEKFNSRSEALKREKFFKSGEGREFLKSII